MAQGHSIRWATAVAVARASNACSRVQVIARRPGSGWMADPQSKSAWMRVRSASSIAASRSSMDRSVFLGLRYSRPAAFQGLSGAGLP